MKKPAIIGRNSLKKRKMNATTLAEGASKHIDKHVIGRYSSLREIRRFILGWITLITTLVLVVVLQTTALRQYYLETRPVDGGVYSEGIVGTFSNANPIYATDVVDMSVSKLLFASLLTYNSKNELVGDLAEKWTSDERGKEYTITLKPAKWHDDTPLTSEDIVYTFNMIKNPDARSPFNQSWRGIAIKAVDERTVTFTLPSPLASFPHSLTIGILPKHILGSIEPQQLRSSEFNTRNPIGAGPYSWVGVTTINQDVSEEQEINVKRFNDYHRGQPHIESITLRTFSSDERMLDAYRSRTIGAVAGVSPEQLTVTDSFNYLAEFPLLSASYIFLNTKDELLADKKVRQGLLHATNTNELLREIGYSVIPVRSPILSGQIGYRSDIQQIALDRARSEQLFEEAGWVFDPKKPDDTIRKKGDKTLEIKILAISTPENGRLTRALQEQWSAVGASAQIELVDAEEVEKRQSLQLHDYQAVLYTINIGHDPDVYAYWHSTQATNGRLNYSNYASDVSDAALDAARTRVDEALRAAKYEPFLNAWRTDAPAIGLYQPRYVVMSRGDIYGRTATPLSIPSDRFYNVHEWYVTTDKVPISY